MSCLSTSTSLHRPVKTIRPLEPLTKGIAFKRLPFPCPLPVCCIISEGDVLLGMQPEGRMDGWQNGRTEERPQNEDELYPTRLITAWPCPVVYAPARVKPPGYPSGWVDRERGGEGTHKEEKKTAEAE